MYETDGAIASDLEFPLTAQSTPFSKGLGRRHHTNKTIVQISDSDPFRGCLPVDPFEYVPLCQNHATLMSQFLYTVRHHCVAYCRLMCPNMTSSVKPEIHNVSQRHQMRISHGYVQKSIKNWQGCRGYWDSYGYSHGCEYRTDMGTMMNPHGSVGILWRFSNGCEIKRKRVKHAINIVVAV